MSKSDRYKTRSLAQKPIKVMLRDPATQEPTEDFIEVRSSLSDEFLLARDLMVQSIAAIRNEANEDRRKELVKHEQLKLKAALVAGWSFDEPCDEDHIIDFLREAPQIQQMVMNVADDSAAFFSRPSADSSTGLEKK